MLTTLHAFQATFLVFLKRAGWLLGAGLTRDLASSGRFPNCVLCPVGCGLAQATRDAVGAEMRTRLILGGECDELAGLVHARSKSGSPPRYTKPGVVLSAGGFDPERAGGTGIELSSWNGSQPAGEGEGTCSLGDWLVIVSRAHLISGGR